MIIATPSKTVPVDWRWALGWSAVVLLLSTIPYIAVWLAAPNGWHFAGILVNPQDGHSYLAKMEQGALGNWLFHLTYTPEAHDGAFIFTYYLALGHLAALTSIPKILVFHLARILGGFGLLLVSFRFIRQITPYQQEQRLAFVLVLTASGLGWLGVIFGAFPIDLWIPEAFVPYSIYANPHFPLAMAIMLFLLGNIIHTGPGRWLWRLSRLSLWSGLGALALALILPFALLTVWAVMAVYCGWRFIMVTRPHLPLSELWLTLSVVIFSAPVIGYQYWVSTRNPIFAGWGAQNITPAPRVIDFLLGVGLVGLLAVVGGWQIIRQKNYPATEWLVLIWAVTTLVLVYLPWELQRRLINGLQLPLCILAAIGLRRWMTNQSLKLRRQRLITNTVVAISAFGTLFVWGLPVIGALQSPEQSTITALFWIHDNEQAAFTWLQTHANPKDVVLASPRISMFIPGQTGVRPFYGHPFETIDAEAKKSQVEAFYAGTIENVTPPANYVFYGPAEQLLGQPKQLTHYPIVFSMGNVAIYRVKEP